jgi:hypothetical protein
MEKVNDKRSRITEISSIAGSVISGLILLVVASFYNDIKSIPVLVYKIQDQKEILSQHEIRISELEKRIYAKN